MTAITRNKPYSSRRELRGMYNGNTKDITDQCAGLYMIYSNDFIVALPVGEAKAKTAISSIIQIIIDTLGLTLKPEKTPIYKTALPYIEHIGETFLRIWKRRG